MSSALMLESKQETIDFPSTSLSKEILSSLIWSTFSFFCWHQVYLNEIVFQPTTMRSLLILRIYNKNSSPIPSLVYDPKTILSRKIPSQYPPQSWPKMILSRNPALAPFARYYKPVISSSTLLHRVNSSHTFPKEMALKL